MDHRRLRLLGAAAPLLALSLACGTGGPSSAPPGSVTRRSNLSLARRGGRECVQREAVAVITDPPAADLVLMEPEDLREGEVQITSCDDLVASFPPLGRCVVAAPLPVQDDPRVSEAIIRATHYVFVGAAVQRARRDCATLGGRWSASTAPDNSRAALRRRVRDLHRAWEALR